MVVMDKQDYINKANQLLNQNTYKVISKDPTTTIKNKLINILKVIKTKTGLGSYSYKAMYPTGCVPPKFYGLPKIHKPDTPLRPIVSSCGSVTYGVAKELAKILKPLVGKSPHHINSTQDFVEQAKHFKLEAGECLSSYDAVCLCSPLSHRSCPQCHQGSIGKGQHPQGKGQLWKLRTLSCYWNFVSKTHTFLSQGQFYEQVEGAAMGSPVSPIVAQPIYGVLRTKSSKHCTQPPQILGQVCG